MKWLNSIVTVLLVFLVASCAVEKRATDVEDVKEQAQKTGFLGDYSDLTPGEGPYEAMLRWHDPTATWGSYEKVIVDPVQIWGDIKKETDKYQDLVALADKATISMRDAIAKRYPVVDKPGPDTLILRMAIADADASSPTMKAISTVLPIGIVASGVTEAVTDKPAFAGDITIEFMVLYSESGKVIAKGVDRRVGGRSLKGVTDSWSTAYAAIDAWANMAVYRICVLSGDKDCPIPPKS